jgi:hypothetical protein
MELPKIILNEKDWQKEFHYVRKFMSAYEPHGNLRIEDGEIIDTTVINVELTRTEADFKMLGEIKLKAINLVDWATRNYDRQRGKWKEIVLAKRGQYPAEKDREDFVNSKTSDDKAILDAAKLIAKAIKDERSRLFNHVKTLQSVGANTRIDRQFDGAVQSVRNSFQKPR